MWFFRRSARVLLSIGLAILFAVLSILRVPQIAWSQLSQPFISPVQSTLVAANNAQEVAQEFRQRFVCVKTSKELSIKSLRGMSEAQIRTTMVRSLANQLKPCIQQNRSRVGTIDVDKLIGVIYTTQILSGDRAVVVVGAGITNTGTDSTTGGGAGSAGSTTGGGAGSAGSTTGGSTTGEGAGSTNNGTTGGAPNNRITVKITNADSVDGTPFTVSDAVTLNASAK